MKGNIFMIRLIYGYEIRCDICGKRSAMTGYRGPIQVEEIKSWKNEWQFDDDKTICPRCKENSDILSTVAISKSQY